VKASIKIRLAAMMFLEFFIWGAWWVTMGSYLSATLHTTGAETGMAYSTQGWGAIIAPFIIGLIADRYFNAERVLGIIHLIGAVLMYILASAGNFANFYPYLLSYMLLFMPTLALVNTVAFRQLPDPARQFGNYRVWGTIGWIVAGALISKLFHWDSVDGVANGALRQTFMMCAGASLLLGLFSFALPATPPKAAGGPRATISDLLGFEALGLLKDRNFLVFFVASILICIPLAFYYQHANQFLTELQVPDSAFKQTFGQMSEVLFMLVLPLFLTRWGLKATLLVGMLTWAVRYALFAYGNGGELAYMLIIGIALHGVCYDFFFVSGQIYTDSKAGARYQSAAQGLITLATYGVGMLIGFWAAGHITDQFALPGGMHDWYRIWIIPAAFAAAVFVLYALTFRNEKVSYGATAVGSK
jgi:nucleoside transporter